MSEFEKRIFNDDHLPKPPRIIKSDSYTQKIDDERMTDHPPAEMKSAFSDIENRMDKRIDRIEKAVEGSSESFRHELALRDAALHREMNLKEKSFRREHNLYAKALDDQLGRMEASASSATQEIKDFKLWMGGIGIAVVLGIMGANATIFGGGKAFFDGGKEATLNEQRIESLLQESKAQTEATQTLLKEIQLKEKALNSVPPSKP